MHFSLMRVATLLVCAFEAVSAFSAIDAFKRVEKVNRPVIERATSKGFQNHRLQKRASPYLNNITQCE